MGQSVITIKLEATRKAMIESAVRHGMASPETLRLSRRLDAMLNVYEKSRSGLSLPESRTGNGRSVPSERNGLEEK